MTQSWIPLVLDTAPLGVQVEIPSSVHPPDDPIEVLATLDDDDFGWAELRAEDVLGDLRYFGITRTGRTLRGVIHPDELPQGPLQVILVVADDVGNVTEVERTVAIHKGEYGYQATTEVVGTQGDRIERSGSYSTSITHESGA